MPSTQVISEYIPTEWFDGTAPAINAANLNHIELGIKNVTNEALSLDGRVTNLEDQQIFIRGMIVAWSGTTTPSGWAFCDGSNGTPDLQDRFILGSHYGNVGHIGGWSDAAVISHDHTFTGTTLPKHKHGYAIYSYTTTNPVGSFEGATVDIGEKAYETSEVSAGTPSGTISTEGVSAIDRNLPPFYKLAYIMKT